jgi:hypothetical protein
MIRPYRGWVVVFASTPSFTASNTNSRRKPAAFH